MNILCINPAVQPWMVALIADDNLVESRSAKPGEEGMAWLSSVISGVAPDPSKLQQVVVINGPGSYTGLRIGVTMANTLAEALKIPVVAVNTLEFLRQAVPENAHGKILLEVYKGGYFFVDIASEAISESSLILLDENQLKESRKQLDESGEGATIFSLTGFSKIELLPEIFLTLVKNTSHSLPGDKIQYVTPFYGREAKITQRKTL